MMRILWFCSIFTLIIGCDKEAGDIPAYLRIPEVSVRVEPGQGAPSHKITDVWIYLEDEFHGAYPVGSDIPVLESGRTGVSFYAGVRMNGVSNFPTVYHMYAPVFDTLDFKPQERIEMPLEFAYKPNTVVAFNEDFESPHRLNVELDEYDTTRLERTGEGVKWGARCGVVTLTKQAPFFKVASDVIFEELNLPNRRVFIELDYKCEAPIYIGFRGNKNPLPPENLLDAIISPREEWNKIYFEFSGFIRGTDWDYYQLMIESAWPVMEDTTVATNVYLDNIKLLYLGS